MTRMTGNLAWEHYSRTKQKAETDASAKFMLLKLLHNEFGLYGLTGESIRIPEGGYADYRLPDVFVKNNVPQYAIELDGYIHGDGDEVSKRESDKQRDYDYSLVNGVQEIIINRSLAKNYEISSIIKILEDAGLKKI